MAYKRKTNQPYRRVTPAVIAKFQKALAEEGNGGAAIRILEPDEPDEYRRAWLVSKKAKELDAGEYIDVQMQQGGIEAVERVRELVHSSDEKIATKNSHFLIDHVRGKALQRSETKHLNLNIEAVL
jgi:hypothetical protein